MNCDFYIHLQRDQIGFSDLTFSELFTFAFEISCSFYVLLSISVTLNVSVTLSAIDLQSNQSKLD